MNVKILKISVGHELDVNNDV